MYIENVGYLIIKMWSKLTLMSKKLKNIFLLPIPAAEKLLLAVILLLFITSCGDQIEVPDISHIEVEVDFYRFDQDFNNLDTLNFVKSISELDTKYPNFAPLFYTRILPLVSPTDPNNKSLLGANVSKYLNDSFAESLYDTVQIVFPNLDTEQKDLETALRYLKYYFPERGDLSVYAFISEFGYQTFIFPDGEGKDGLGLGLDMFLGVDYPYKALIIKNATFSDYITRSFNQEHLVKKLMDSVIDDLAGESMGERLLDKIIVSGKKQYLLDKVLPYTPDSIKWEFTSQQMDWVKGNEVNIYVHILSEDLLYETRTKKIKSLIDYSPSSKGMPPESPGRTANYIGYKIVDRFMDRTKINLDSLIRIQDAQFILDNSKYKPLNKK
jgi:hypothetical protein